MTRSIRNVARARHAMAVAEATRAVPWPQRFSALVRMPGVIAPKLKVRWVPNDNGLFRRPHAFTDAGASDEASAFASVPAADQEQGAAVQPDDAGAVGVRDPVPRGG